MSNKCSGCTWVLTASRCLVQRWFILWKQRCDERHGIDAESRRAARLIRVHSQLTELYAIRMAVRPRDRQYYHANVEQHLELHPDLNVVKNWISTFWDTLQASAALARAHGINNLQSIRDWLQPLHSTP